MGYRNIVISSSVKVSVKNSQLVITGEANGTVPVEDIQTLMLESRASSITTYALSELSGKGVCVYICDEKHLPCAVIQPIGRFSRQRKRIMTQINQTKPKLKHLWKEIVVRKIQNQARCLKYCRSEINKYSVIEQLSKNVCSGDESNIEGRVAALYFKTLFGNAFFRDDDNDVNSALNYGYAIVRGYIARVLANCGFEPCIGIHHSSELNNYNLADDLIEPFRPLVDLFVVQKMKNREFDSDCKRALCNILNYDVISSGKRYSAGRAVELLVQSLERCFDSKTEELILPELCELKLHEYE